MCGIIAVVRRASDRPGPTSDEVIAPLRDALAILSDRADGAAPSVAQLHAATALVAGVNLLLRPAVGVAALLSRPELAFEVESSIDDLGVVIAALD